jgi:hypothetical protein
MEKREDGSEDKAISLKCQYRCVFRDFMTTFHPSNQYGDCVVHIVLYSLYVGL